ncbi:MAG: Hsp70 family protein, partial [Mycobacterium sp.]
MAEEARPALGLSIGATNLAAVTLDRAVTRKPVLTLYRQRPPEVGVPSENPRLDEPGLVITDFVDRVGDPIGIVAADGSAHRGETLIADGLRALAYSAAAGRTPPDSVAVTYPAHWGLKAVDALGASVSRVAEWSNRARPLTLIPDAAAALLAARANPGIPARGVVAVCDFGGSGTNITLVDAAGDYQPLAPTLRHHDFSGDLIDQALLMAVMANCPSAGLSDPSGTSAIGSLSRLRASCRSAKEQLSSSTATTLTDGDIRLTRNELDDAIRDSLNAFLTVLEETIRGNGIRPSDLVAVVSVGGVANIPAVTTKLSGSLRVPVVTTPRPQLTAAIGAALRASRGPGDTTATVLTPAASMNSAPLVPPGPAAERAAAAQADWPEARLSEPAMGAMPVLAWSESNDDSRVMPVRTGEYAKSSGGSGYTSARPALNFKQTARPRPEPKPAVIPWYRVPAVLAIGTAVAVLLVGMAVAIGFGSDDKPATTSVPGVSTAPVSSAPASPMPADGTPQPPPAAPDAPQPETPPQQAPAPAPA